MKKSIISKINGSIADGVQRIEITAFENGEEPSFGDNEFCVDVEFEGWLYTGYGRTLAAALDTAISRARLHERRR